MIYRNVKGLTLIECMLLVALLGIISLGFGIGLQSIAHIPDGVDQRLAFHTFLVEKMEDIMSLDFTAINSSLSDSIQYQGRTYPRTVTVAILETDFKEITVTIADQYLKTRMTQP
jgi:hypothetical protein